jgi:penicillin-binding protein 1A
VWIGHDTPRKLGDRETGGGLALPVWIEYMSHALKKLPEQTAVVPEGLVQHNGDWLYEEYSGDAGVSSVGLDDKLPAAATETERKSILDLFR